jgi:hypothetical protein
MAGSNTAVFGIYGSRTAAENAADALISAGFRQADISVLMADMESTRQFAHEKNTKAPEGATTGAVAGGAIGGTLGVLAGIGAIAIPGVGPLIAAGPIMGLLAGLGAGGAVGTLVGALIGMGIPEYEAKRYEGRVKNGGILLSVHCDNSDWVDKAKHILEETGADDVSSAGEKSASTHGVHETKGKPVPSDRTYNQTDATYTDSDAKYTEGDANYTESDPTYREQKREKIIR